MSEEGKAKLRIPKSRRLDTAGHTKEEIEFRYGKPHSEFKGSGCWPTPSMLAQFLKNRTADPWCRTSDGRRIREATSHIKLTGFK